MATKISKNEKLSGSHRHWPIVSRPNNFPKFIPFARSAKKKRFIRVSPCGRTMIRYWNNDYVDTQSKTQCPLKCVDVIGSHCEEGISDVADGAPSDGRIATRIATTYNKLTSFMKDTGFSKKYNCVPVDKCQGIIASVVVYKTGVTEYWFYRRGLISTIHYKETSKKTLTI